MSEILPVLYLARHGETAWSLTGQHTGFTDLPLTERGEHNARLLGKRLAGLTFARVFTSPLQRATRTCELAGFAAVAEVDRNLVEWNCRDSRDASGVAIIPQRLSGRGIAGPSCCQGRSGCESRAREQRQCPDFFERAFFANARCTLARTRTRQWKIFYVEHGESKRARL